MKNSFWMLSIILFVASAFTAPQARTVTGRVTDVDGHTPLPGISVVVKGTTLGTVTDPSGNYSISVSSEKSILVFSFIGYKTIEVSTAGKSKVNVTMTADVAALNETVVVGHGKEKMPKWP
jgi:hypothetical protein